MTPIDWKPPTLERTGQPVVLHVIFECRRAKRGALTDTGVVRGKRHVLKTTCDNTFIVASLDRLSRVHDGFQN